VDGRVLRS